MKKMKATLLAAVIISLFTQAANADTIGGSVTGREIAKNSLLIGAVKKTNKAVQSTKSSKNANTGKTLAQTVKKYKYFKLGDNNTLFVYVPATYHMVNPQAVQYKRYYSELAVINKNFYQKNKNFAKFYIVYDSQMSYAEFEKLFKKEKSNKNLSPLTVEQAIAKFKYFKIGKDGKIHIYSAAKGDYLDKQFYDENKIFTTMRRYQPFQKNYVVEATVDLQMEYDQWKNMVEGKEYQVKVINEKDKQQVEDAKNIKPVKDVRSASDDKFVKEFLDILNRKRQEANLQPLTADDSLNNLAKWKAQYMSKNKHFNHILQDGSDMRKQVEDFGLELRGTWAENIAFSTDSFTAQELFDQWYSSEGHRQNMMNPKFTKMGLGVEDGYASQWFRSE